MKETIKDSNREALPKLLEEWACSVLDGNRNALFPGYSNARRFSFWRHRQTCHDAGGKTRCLRRPTALAEKRGKNGQKEERWLICGKTRKYGQRETPSKSFGLTKSTFQNVTGKNLRIFEAQQSKAAVALMKPRVSSTIWWNGQSKLNNQL